MTQDEELLTLPINLKEDTYIKVMGIGGGGCNVVSYMHKQGIQDVTFLVCNTDKQQLSKISIPAKLQLGPGLGAGGRPEQAKKYAEESLDRIHEALDDGTKMLFITAGMGGGTGTGASAIVAQVAQEMDILTVGIVTIPFAFEGKLKIHKAMTGVATLAKHVDALLVINNEKLKQIYPDLNLLNAFEKANDVVCNAAKAIAEIITVPGYINTDFADVRNTLKNGNIAIMNVGQANGEGRITQAIENALKSPLVNSSDVHGAKRILLQFYCSTEHAIQMNEIDQINAFVKEVGEDVEVQWGASLDESLGENVRVTIIATGYEISDIPVLDDELTVGDTSVDDAINKAYNPEEPPVVPNDDEPTQQVDLNGVLQQGEAEVPAAPVETPIDNTRVEDTRVPAQEGQEITINFDDDVKDEPKPAAPAAPQPAPSRFSGWIRGRK